MPAPGKRPELLRLQKAFEAEADKFHDLTLTILYFAKGIVPSDRQFRSPNHQIMLWQYYGQMGESESSVDGLIDDMKRSNIERFGLSGSKFSCYALLEGEPTQNFIRMALRAGNVFSDKEAQRIEFRALHDFSSNLPASATGKPVFTGNRNRLAVWLNHVLHHLGRTHPRYMPEAKIDLDPYAASLSAIDALLHKPDRKSPVSIGIDRMRFQVALSFPGEHRAYVESVASLLQMKLGSDAVFYDNYFQPDLARPNLDILLQRIYRDNSDLIVVFLCADYASKEWCGLEWRAIRDIIKQRDDAKVMFLRLDDAPVPGVFGIDGYIDIAAWPADRVAGAIETRLRSLPG